MLEEVEKVFAALRQLREGGSENHELSDKVSIRFESGSETDRKYHRA
jgi:hypothetical protein